MSKRNQGAKSNPGRIRTGISRAILLQLSLDKGRTIEQLLELLGPRGEGVTRGTVWTTLDRYRALGLVRTETTDGRERPNWYFLTDGGQRRVDWIRKRKVEPVRVRAIANPGSEEE